MTKEITEDPSLGVQSLRWENAKTLIFKFKSHCLINNLGFILEYDSEVLESSNVIIKDNEINIVKDNCSLNLFIADVSYDHGIHDTTEEWFNSCALFSAKLVSLEPENSFKDLVSVEYDTIN